MTGRLHPRSLYERKDLLCSLQSRSIGGWEAQLRLTAEVVVVAPDTTRLAAVRDVGALVARALERQVDV